jgi:hypothetical protein
MNEPLFQLKHRLKKPTSGNNLLIKIWDGTARVSKGYMALSYST